MSRRTGKPHVVRVKKTYTDKQGNERVYESVLLRRSYRDGANVRNETLANLSTLPEVAVTALEAALKGHALVPAGREFTVLRALPHGHVAAVAAMARRLNLPAVWGPPSRSRDLISSMVICRVIDPTSTRATLSRWRDTTLATDLGVAGASIDEVHAAMDWLLARRAVIETELAGKHLRPDRQPSRLALLALTRSWVAAPPEAQHPGHRQTVLTRINYGVLTDRGARPLAARVLPVGVDESVISTDTLTAIRTRFGLDRLVLVGHPRMIPAARIDALRDLDDAGHGFGWITALPSQAIVELSAGYGPLWPSLFDTHRLVEVSHPAYPSERLIAGRDPALAAGAARNRDESLTAAEAQLAAITERVESGALTGAENIAQAVTRVTAKSQVGKYFRHTITDAGFSWERDHRSIAADTALDGVYVLRTNVSATELDSAGVAAAYTNVALLEREFRVIRTEDLDLRPSCTRLADQAEAHALVCQLACYLSWHLRQAWAPLTSAPPGPPKPDRRIAAPHHRGHSAALHNFRDVLHHLATLTRNTIRYHHNATEVHTLTEPTLVQRRAFDLIGTTIPPTVPT